MRIITKPRRWGNSLGIIIPKKIAEKENITTEAEVCIEIKKENPLKRVCGILKDSGMDAQKIKNELRNKERVAEKRKWRKLSIS